MQNDIYRKTIFNMILFAYFLVICSAPENLCLPEKRATLMETAKQLSLDENCREKAIELYEALLRCGPKNPDTLFYLGRLYYWTQQYAKARSVLCKCITLAPDYNDAWFILASVELADKNGAKATCLFRSVLQADPNYLEARKGLARALSLEQKYTEAKKEYQILVNNQPNEESNWIERMNVLSHTNIACQAKVSYVEGIEDDPAIGAPVVKEYYFTSTVECRVPIFNRWRLDARQIYMKRKENDIFPPIGTNFNVNINGAELISQYFFLPDWKWSLSARTLYAKGEGQEMFPFHSTTRFEPGTFVFYSTEWVSLDRKSVV